MNFVAPAVFGFFIAYCVGAMVYVYKFRGRARFANFGTYVRKGWAIFAPLNCFLYLCTKRSQRKAVLGGEELAAFRALRENAGVLRKEAQAIMQGGYFELGKDEGKSAHYDIGFRSFHKYGWGKFYLKWYGYEHPSAAKFCPQTVKLLAAIPQVNGAMFAHLPPGSELTPHMDPVACSLRYHLALDAPNSAKCFINVDGEDVVWRNGRDFLFDETYIHYARNDTEAQRLILLCDVERRMNVFGRGLNAIYKMLMRAAAVPNTEEDRGGWASRSFEGVAGVLAMGKRLKARNRGAYLAVKYCVNGVILAGILGVVGGLIWLPMVVLGLV